MEENYKAILKITIMNKITSARKYKSPILQELLAEVTPLEMEQTKVKMQLAVRIEDYMKAKGWNKSQFAEQVGKNPSEITRWLSGTQNFTIDVLTEIAYTLGAELATLLGKQQQNQVIYRNQIVVKVTAVQSAIKLSTPYKEGIDLYGTHYFTGQVSKSFSSQYHQA